MDHVVKGSEIHSAEYADLSGNGSVSAYDVHLLLDQLEGYEEDGTLYVSAAQAVGVTGVAPDAQLITMKVFGKKGGGGRCGSGLRHGEPVPGRPLSRLCHRP